MMTYAEYHKMVDETFNWEGGDPMDEINENYDEMDIDEEIWRLMTTGQEEGENK